MNNNDERIFVLGRKKGGRRLDLHLRLKQMLGHRNRQVLKWVIIVKGNFFCKSIKNFYKDNQYFISTVNVKHKVPVKTICANKMSTFGRTNKTGLVKYP